MIKKLLVAGAAALTLAGCSNQAANQQYSSDEIGKVAYDYLIEHPDFLEKSVQALKAQKEQAYLSSIAQKSFDNLDQLLSDKTSPALGSDKPKVTIVEFFDYQCVYCAGMAPELKQLMQDNPELKVVFKETPIFGQRWHASRHAAEVALKAYNQKGAKGYEAFHDNLFSTGKVESKLTEADVNAVAKKIGVDISAGNTSNTVNGNLALFQSLGFRGTPAMLVIPEGATSAEQITVIAGADINSLKQAITDITEGKKQS